MIQQDETTSLHLEDVDFAEASLGFGLREDTDTSAEASLPAQIYEKLMHCALFFSRQDDRCLSYCTGHRVLPAQTWPARPATQSLPIRYVEASVWHCHCARTQRTRAALPRERVLAGTRRAADEGVHSGRGTPVQAAEVLHEGAHVDGRDADLRTADCRVRHASELGAAA